MEQLARFMEVTGISEDEALSALVAAFAPPQLGPLRQNWKRQPQFGNSAPDTATLKNLFEDADFRCTDCGSQLRLGIDHIDSDGTNHDVSNLKVLCFSCNRAKGKGKSENLHHGRRLVMGVIELYDETGTFPDNKSIKERADITRVGRPQLMAYLKKRLEAGSQPDETTPNSGT